MALAASVYAWSGNTVDSRGFVLARLQFSALDADTLEQVGTACRVCAGHLPVTCCLALRKVLQHLHQTTVGAPQMSSW